MAKSVPKGKSKAKPPPPPPPKKRQSSSPPPIPGSSLPPKIPRLIGGAIATRPPPAPNPTELAARIATIDADLAEIRVQIATVGTITPATEALALEAMREELGDLMVEARSRLATLTSAVAALDARMSELEANTHKKLSTAAPKSEVDRRVKALEEKVQRLSGRLADQDPRFIARLEKLEGLFEELVEERAAGVDLDSLQARLDDLEALTVNVGNEERDLKVKVAAQEGELARLRESMVPPNPGQDLTRIKGIGPKLRDRLRENGIKSIEMVAGWSDEDAARIADQLRIKTGRVQGWIIEAKKLKT